MKNDGLDELRPKNSLAKKMKKIFLKKGGYYAFFFIANKLIKKNIYWFNFQNILNNKVISFIIAQNQ